MRILVETIEAQPFDVGEGIRDGTDPERAPASRSQGAEFDTELQASPLSGPEICHGGKVAGVGASGPVANAMFPRDAGRSPFESSGPADVAGGLG